MTTQIHIINYGPQPVKVELQRPDGQNTDELVYPRTGKAFYVYKGQVVVVSEQETTT